MSAPITDLAPGVAAMLIAHWRTAPVWQKLAYINELNDTLKLLATSDLRQRYPQENQTQLQRRLATRWLGVELAQRIYGPEPDGYDATN